MSAKKRKITDFFGGKSKNDEEVDPKQMKCPKKSLTWADLPKSTSKPRSKKENIDLSQRILDLGQAEIGNVYCEKCNMMFCVDCAEDVERHRIYHNRFKDTANFNINKSLINILGSDCANKKIGEHRIVHVGANSPKIVKNSVEYWLKFVNEAIGYVSEKNIWNPDRRIYLNMGLSQESEVFLAGLLVIEQLSQAVTEQTEEIIEKNKNNDWIVGVDRIWTHPTKRRSGIGSALLDAATTRDKELNFRERRLRIAFSELSEEGKLFAKNYVKLHYTPNQKFGDQLLTY